MDNYKIYAKKVKEYLNDEKNIDKLTWLSSLTQAQLFELFKNKEVEWFELRINGFIKNEIKGE